MGIKLRVFGHTFALARGSSRDPHGNMHSVRGLKLSLEPIIMASRLISEGLRLSKSSNFHTASRVSATNVVRTADTVPRQRVEKDRHTLSGGSHNIDCPPKGTFPAITVVGLRNFCREVMVRSKRSKSVSVGCQ